MAHQHLEPSRAERAAHHSELVRFLAQLAQAITAGDDAAVAAHWEVPAFVIGGGIAKPLANSHEIAELFGGARAQYNAQGVTDTKPQIESEDWIDDNLVVVRVRWPYLDARGHEIGAEASDYTISRDSSGALRLRVAVMRGVEGAKTGMPS